MHGYFNGGGTWRVARPTEWLHGQRRCARLRRRLVGAGCSAPLSVRVARHSRAVSASGRAPGRGQRRVRQRIDGGWRLANEGTFGWRLCSAVGMNSGPEGVGGARETGERQMMSQTEGGGSKCQAPGRSTTRPVRSRESAPYRSTPTGRTIAGTTAALACILGGWGRPAPALAGYIHLDRWTSGHGALSIDIVRALSHLSAPARHEGLCDRCTVSPSTRFPPPISAFPPPISAFLPPIAPAPTQSASRPCRFAAESVQLS